MMSQAINFYQRLCASLSCSLRKPLNIFFPRRPSCPKQSEFQLHASLVKGCRGHVKLLQPFKESLNALQGFQGFPQTNLMDEVHDLTVWLPKSLKKNSRVPFPEHKAHCTGALPSAATLPPQDPPAAHSRGSLETKAPEPQKGGVSETTLCRQPGDSSSPSLAKFRNGHIERSRKA